MLLMDAYVSLSEEPLLGGPGGVAVLVPDAHCGLNCVFCYLRCAHSKRNWTARRIAEWVLDQGVQAMEWCGWPALQEAREVARLLEGKVTIILKTSGADAGRLAVMLEANRPFFDVYLPDMKFGNASTAGLLAGRPDYVIQSARTLEVMGRRFCAQQYAADGRLIRGVLVRHLILPGFSDDTARVIRHFADYAGRYRWPLSLTGAYMPPRGIASSIEALSSAAPSRGNALRCLLGLLPDGEFEQARSAARARGIEVI